MSSGFSDKAALLIINRDFVVRRMLEDILDEEYECVLARSVEEGLQLLDSQGFSVVVSDSSTDGITNREFTSLVSAKMPDAVVIITAAHNDIETALDALRAGAFDYITEPVDWERVLPSVKRAVQHHELLKETRAYQIRLAETLQRGRDLEETRAFIAHEFRHALTPLNAYVKMLDEALALPDADKEKLSSLMARIRKQTDATFDLLNRYLDYSRPLAPQFIRTEINDLLQESLEEVKPEFESRRIVIQSQLVENARADVDRQMLAQVLRNVIANAIQAIDNDGTLAVATRIDKNSVVFTIRDTGKGLAPEHLSRIFEIGFTTKPGVRGAGVGLALSKRIIEEAHNGSIAIANNTDGPGATVLITLPTKQTEITNGRHLLALADR